MDGDTRLSRSETIAIGVIPDTWIFMRFAALFLVAASFFVIGCMIFGNANFGSSITIATVFLTLAYVLFIESIPCRLHPERYRD